MQPSKTDHNDPLYSKKYAHTLPPPDAYRFRHPDSLLQNSKEKPTIRLFFYGWNNLSEFENQQIENIKKYLKETQKVDIPKDFDDRELLKFVQANNFDLQKSGVKLSNHFKWLSDIAGVKITPGILKLI